MVYSAKGRSNRCGPQMGNMGKHQCSCRWQPWAGVSVADERGVARVTRYDGVFAQNIERVPAAPHPPLTRSPFSWIIPAPGYGGQATHRRSGDVGVIHGLGVDAADARRVGRVADEELLVNGVFQRGLDGGAGEAIL